MGHAQQVDFENLKGLKSVKVSGAVSANTVYYDSNGRNARDPFTYIAQGNIDVSWFSFSMPLGYSYSNQGDNLDYEVPFKFNRLSLHPKYKGIQAHIGDVSMGFSPYTLNGYQFTGGGVELTPKGSWSFSAMGGRLLRAVEPDDDARTQPSFDRMGYGAKLGWEGDTYTLGLIGFYAQDKVNSLSIVPDIEGFAPKENLVVSIAGEWALQKDLKLQVEYAASALTQDSRAEEGDGATANLAGLFLNNKTSTEYFNALKAAMDYNFGNMKVGLGFERIDPSYETLGAYYFNNDFQNITLNASRPVFDNRLQLTFDMGYQQDNLNNQKIQTTNRVVGAINATYKWNDKINLVAGYSNFTTHTNKSLNQFDDINDNDLTDEQLETLDYKQLSQNSNLNLNWILAQSPKNSQNLNLAYSLAASANEQEGIIRVGQANNFHNGNMTYSIGYPKRTLNLSASLNYNYSDIGMNDSQAMGGAVNLGKVFFKNALKTTFGGAYNSTTNEEATSAVLNFRAMGAYTLAKKHNFNLNVVQLFRKTTDQQVLREFTLTLGYTYAFSVGKPQFKKGKQKEVDFGFIYREHEFKGSHQKISSEVSSLIHSPDFASLKEVEGIVRNLALLEKGIRQSEGGKDRKYKESALDYLRHLYKHKDFLDIYHQLTFKSLKLLYRDALRLDLRVEKEYVILQAKINTLKQKGKKVLQVDLESLKRKERQQYAHKWMQQQLNEISYEDITTSKGLLKRFKKKYISKVFDMLEVETPKEVIFEFLQVSFADFYHKRALEDLELE
ncbi:MAG: hypothetical protein ABJN84_08785 [Flavobacteriaceae bacterium]